VFDIEWAPTSDSFIVAKDDVTLYDIVTFEQLWTLHPAAPADTPSAAEFGLNGTDLYLYDTSWGIQVRDVSTGGLLRNGRDDPNTFGGCLQGDAEDATWAPDGKSLLITIADQRDPAADVAETQVWDSSSLRCREEFARTSGWNSVLDVSSDGRYLALGSVLEVSQSGTDGIDIEFGQVAVWDLGMPSHPQICAAGRGTFAQFRPGTAILASPDPERNGIAYWDVGTCEIIARIPGVPAPYDIAFSPEGDFLIAVLDKIWVISSDSGEVLLVVEHTSLSEPSGFDLRQNSLNMSPDGQYLLTYSAYPPDQSTLILWAIQR
jgi:WD40 repeat protein